MGRFDRYIGPLMFFTFGYFICLVVIDTALARELHVTVNEVPHLIPATGVPTAFWIYVSFSLAIGLLLLLFGIYSAVSAYRFRDPARLRPTGPFAMLRIVGLWFIGVIVFATIHYLRKWI